MHKDIPSAEYPTVSVHITWPDKEGKVTLRAYAMDTATGVRKEYGKERKIEAKSSAEIPIKQQHLYVRVCKDIARYEIQPVSAAPVAVLSPMYLAFDALESSPDPVSSDWSPEYTRKNLTYFKRNVLPILAANINDLTADTKEQLRQQITEKILKSGRSIGHEPTAIATAIKELGVADTIYQRMRDFDPALPEITLRTVAGRRSKNEQMKSIPPAVRREFEGLVEALTAENPRLAMSIICMYDAGLRTAEAAAVWSDVILFTDIASSILVRYQVKNGKRSKLLKTRNSYRLVPFSTWGHTMLARCIAILSAAPDDEAYWVCDTRLLSATVKSMLVKAGLTEDYLTAAERTMRDKPDYDEVGRPIYDVSAYILRRDWASRARNVCGYTSIEIDYSLGHDVKIPKKRREDLRHLSNQAKLSAKLERYVHNPLYSKHPGCSPYSIQHASELEIIPYDVVRLKNTSDECVWVSLDVEAVCNTDSIVILTPKDSQVKSTQRSINTKCKRKDEPIIGKALLLEDGTYGSDSF